MDSKELRGLMEAYSEVYAHQEVDEATAVASPAPGGRGRKNPYTKEIRTSAQTKTSSGYSNVSDAKNRMKKPLSRYPKPEMQLKDVKEAQYTPPPQPQQPPAEVRKAPKKAPNPITTVGTGLAAAYVGNEIGKQLLKKKPVRGVFEELDIYDIVLSHLLDEGYAETLEAAEAIMVNMSEEWREDIIDEAYVDYRKGRLPSGRTPQTALKSGVERAKVNASREQRAGGSFGTTATPSWKRSKKADAVGREMDAHTGVGGKINKALSPGLGNRPGAGPRVAYGEPNTDRHQGARYRRGQPSTKD